MSTSNIKLPPEKQKSFMQTKSDNNESFSLNKNSNGNIQRPSSSIVSTTDKKKTEQQNEKHLSQDVEFRMKQKKAKTNKDFKPLTISANSNSIYDCHPDSLNAEFIEANIHKLRQKFPELSEAELYSINANEIEEYKQSQNDYLTPVSPEVRLSTEMSCLKIAPAELSPLLNQGRAAFDHKTSSPYPPLSYEIPRMDANPRIAVPDVVLFQAGVELVNPNGNQRMDDVVAFLDEIGLPNVINLFNNAEDDRLEALRTLHNVITHGIITIKFILFLDELMRCRAMRVFRPRREFFDEAFYLAFGFTPAQAQTLLLRIGRHFQRNTRANWAFYTPEILMMTLRKLRVGSTFWDAGYFIGGSRPSANSCFWECIDAILLELADLITLEGTPEQWMHQAGTFYNKYGISNAVGAIDGSYIWIRNIDDANNWICRKGYAAINLTMFVDPSKRIRFISCRRAGSMADINVYRFSGLAQMVREGWEPFPGAVILGDSAYIGADRFIVPYPREHQIQPFERPFYEAHKEARSIVERVYGEMKGKFGILSRRTGPMNFATRDACSDVIKACCFLYNFWLQQRGEIDDDDDHIYFRDLDPNRTPAEDLIEIFNEDNV